MIRSRSAILTWHSVDGSGSPISIAPDVFREQVEALAESRIPVVPLREIRQSWGCVSLTFDDGFANLADHALPLLEKYRFPATIFIVSGYCGTSNFWPSQPLRVPRLPLLTWDQLSALPRQFTIGAHTVNHPDLTRVSPAECDLELRQCQETIEDRLGRPTREFAYPYGVVTSPVRQAVSRYFEIAVGTHLSYVHRTSQAHQLPRLDAYYLQSARRMNRLFTPEGRWYIRLRNIPRTSRQFAVRLRG
jgi:peptidoglycan/xylan/chitin deacetylase (PgdA/CDA1 family)